MTILNIANDGYYNVLVTLCGALAVEGDTNKDKLIDICSNKEENARKRVSQTLLRWTQLGLFVENDSKISFCDDAKNIKLNKGNIDKFRDQLKSVIRNILFDQSNNKYFWDSERTKAADFTRALSWVLAQDIYNFSLAKIDKVQTFESLQIKDPEKRPIQNDVRLNGLRVWANYLGFACKFKELMVDPTEAIKQEVLCLFKKNKAYAADDFVSGLAERLPVLDGGEYRLKVERELDPQQWRKPQNPETLSTSLSRALWRLELSGFIELEARADARKNRVIQREDGHQLKSFTHVVYRGTGQ